ncbi:zinc metalloprotease [Candidatus Methylacidithermus pantelleriae]|uniref:Peptidase family M50 n=1 Tax=Candidatus Methylacidithermus pantelleriae TaxID=2744239 RepID=A0A8J2BKF4_9BACT|nr:hypothetical protein [Candidatus Methylacidithermus pantelleriae]CAF0702487.1 membrane hypothetical protein [Candidatus Methylacidithermus pantelleriae]
MNTLWIVFVLFCAGYAWIGYVLAFPKKERNEREDDVPALSWETEGPIIEKALEGVIHTRWQGEGPQGTLELVGSLTGIAASEAFDTVRKRLADTQIDVYFLGEEEAQVRLTFQRSHPPQPPSPKLLPSILFFLTLATTAWAGGFHHGITLPLEPSKALLAFQGAWPIWATLLAQDVTRYAIAFLHGIRLGPPYWLPAPLALGTFGSVLPVRHSGVERRGLYDSAAFGVIAGLAVALPCLWFGLKNSSFVSGSPLPFAPGVPLRSSVFFWVFSQLAHGDKVTLEQRAVLDPLAFGGWVGLLVTTLNLLPVSGLNGGWLAHALWGIRALRRISLSTVLFLFLFCLFFWPALLSWVLFLSLLHLGPCRPVQNELASPGWLRTLLGYLLWALAGLVLLPVPPSWKDLWTLHGPYL